METPFGTVPDRLLADMSMAEAHDYLQPRLSRRSLLRAGVLLAGSAAAGPVLWQRPGSAAVRPRGAHLAFGSNPRREMTVSWYTAGPVERAVLEVGLDTTYGLRVPADGRSVAGTRSVYHHAPVTGLRPGTTYHYRLRHRGGVSADRTFTTAPRRPEPFRFTAFGDQGVGAEADANVARLRRLQPAFHFHVGDLCYATTPGNGWTGVTDQTVWDEWLRQNAPQSGRAPWMPTVGNHEMEVGFGAHGYAGFNRRFELPGNGPSRNTYAFRYGNVGVIALDGNDASYEFSANRGWLGTDQDRWLRDRLAAFRDGTTVDFVVVGFHNCAYCTNTKHGSDGGMRDRWVALFDEFGVDLVVNGHNHQYERTYPLRAGVATPAGSVVRPVTDGTTYVTAGGGGRGGPESSLYPNSYVVRPDGSEEPETAEWSAVRYLGTSVLVADADPLTADGQATLRLRGVTPAGTVVDDVTLQRPAKAAAAAQPRFLYASA